MRRIVSWMILASFLLGTFTLAFNVGLVRAQAESTVYINSDGSVSPSNAPISSPDDVTYTFTGNISYPTYDGIVVERNNTVIDGNGYTVQGNISEAVTDQSPGLNLRDTSNVTIRNTNIKSFYYGIFLDSSSNNNTVIGNTAAANLYGIFLNSSSNNIVTWNNATENSAGICLYVSSNNNTVSGNNVTANGVGICLSGSSNDNIVSGNNAAANDSAGIDLYSSSNNTISGNNATASSYYGIVLEDASNNTVSGNNATANSEYGIWLYFSSNNNTVSSNNVTENSAGIFLRDYSNNNTVSGNNVTANGTGIWLEVCSNTTIYHNNFIGNPAQARVDLGSSGNAWDNGYPSGGNYWSDYIGTDLYSGPYQNVTGSDGIGDTPYVIGANDADHYPLMGGFSDFNVAEGVDVQVVSNSTVSDFQFNGTALLFDVSGTNDTTGFCNVCVPTSLVNGNLTVLVNGTQVQYSLLSTSNSDQTYLYFTYGHSTEQVIIMPEFPDSLIMVMFMLATLAAIAINKKKHGRSLSFCLFARRFF